MNTKFKKPSKRVKKNMYISLTRFKKKTESLSAYKPILNMKLFKITIYNVKLCFKKEYVKVGQGIPLSSTTEFRSYRLKCY